MTGRPTLLALALMAIAGSTPLVGQAAKPAASAAHVYLSPT